MTRISKQGELRSISKRRPRPPSLKTGPKRDALTHGYRPHDNVATISTRFIPKIS